MCICDCCGEEVLVLEQGYCLDCFEENQAALDEHNDSFDRWEQMTSQERENAIRFELI